MFFLDISNKLTRFFLKLQNLSKAQNSRSSLSSLFLRLQIISKAVFIFIRIAFRKLHRIMLIVCGGEGERVVALGLNIKVRRFLFKVSQKMERA